MAYLSVGHAPGNPGTSATQPFHSLHTQAEKVDPARSRSTDKADMTKVFDSQIFINIILAKRIGDLQSGGCKNDDHNGWKYQ